ncbi:hypothetical protein I4U23_000945 [Adineta vaga]|nr:hypothetical protein I4U23_000945 [Adineta vaga]
MLLISLIILLVCSINYFHCLSCFKCMTTNFENDTCKDPFNPIDNHLEIDCQATSNGRNGLFPARFCVKISGIIVDVDRHVNRSLLQKSLFLRTCIIDNIMDSTRSSDSTGNFRLKNFNEIKSVRMQGTITVCSSDGCNRTNTIQINRILLNFLIFFLIIYYFK